MKTDIYNNELSDMKKPLLRSSLKKGEKKQANQEIEMKHITLKDKPQIHPINRNREQRRQEIKRKLSSNLTHYDRIAMRKNDEISVFAFIGFLLTILLLWVDFDHENKEMLDTPFCTFLRCLISLSTIILVFMQLNYYQVLAEIEDTKWGFPTLWSSLFSTNLLKRAGIEMAICAIHPLPFLGKEWDKVGLFMILRIYIVIRFLKYHSKIFKQRYRILNDIPYIKRHRPIFGWKLVIKVFFYTHPVTSIIITYSFIIFGGAFCIHVAERTTHDDLRYYGNAVYMTVISCTSIGYGDITPHTYLGKFIVGIFAIVGICTLSLLVSVGDRALRMRSVEHYSIEYISCLELKTKIGNVSAVYVQNVWRLRGLMHKNKASWPYNPEDAAKLSLFQQRSVAIYVGKIKGASRSMHRYRIRELGFSTFIKDNIKKDRNGKTILLQKKANGLVLWRIVLRRFNLILRRKWFPGVSYADRNQKKDFEWYCLETIYEEKVIKAWNMFNGCRILQKKYYPHGKEINKKSTEPGGEEDEDDDDKELEQDMNKIGTNIQRNFQMSRMKTVEKVK